MNERKKIFGTGVGWFFFFFHKNQLWVKKGVSVSLILLLEVMILLKTRIVGYVDFPNYPEYCMRY